MNKQLKQALDRELQPIVWTAQNECAVAAAIREKGTAPMKHKLPRTLLVAAIVLSLTLGALAATTLIFSDRVSRQLDADRILEAAYGLTPEMLTWFIREDGDGIVTYHPRSGYDYVLGEYTVTPGSTPAAAWSWDGTEPSDTLDAAPWGARALQLALDLAVRLSPVIGNPSDDPIAAIAPVIGNTPDDTIAATARQIIPTETLVETGREAIMNVYGLAPEIMSCLRHVTENNLFVMVDDAPCLFLWFGTDFQGLKNEAIQALSCHEGIYTVCVNAETGVIEFINFESVAYGNG